MISKTDNTVSKNLLDMLMEKTDKRKTKKAWASPDNSSARAIGNDTVSISTSTRTTINASIAINMSATTTTNGRVDVIKSDQANTWMQLPKYAVKSGTGEHYLSKALPPAKSEEEFEKAILDIAKKHALAGSYRIEDKEVTQLLDSYISVASPDRAGIIASAAGKAAIPADIDYTMAKAYDEHGNEIAYYGHENGWSNVLTKEEFARNDKFWKIYETAFKEARNPTLSQSVQIHEQIQMDISA